jgi:hypothetical protein
MEWAKIGFQQKISVFGKLKQLIKPVKGNRTVGAIIVIM